MDLSYCPDKKLPLNMYKDVLVRLAVEVSFASSPLTRPRALVPRKSGGDEDGRSGLPVRHYAPRIDSERSSTDRLVPDTLRYT